MDTIAYQELEKEYLNLQRKFIEKKIELQEIEQTYQSQIDHLKEELATSKSNENVWFSSYIEIKRKHENTNIENTDPQ